jgi:hypothetical protein
VHELVYTLDPSIEPSKNYWFLITLFIQLKEATTPEWYRLVRSWCIGAILSTVTDCVALVGLHVIMQADRK